ncbi:hypothetical protein [Hymenobacter terricola]|uniref:hypothetical protein n=1 Tax=Hymenobacter terricola TaxID=2819236 RepID=UPI001CF3D55A|nr:hypothetical protein [Hymenobacter terricola]
MRQNDFDFAQELLTQAGLQPVELASTPYRVLVVTPVTETPVAWLFDNDGTFLRFESDFMLSVIQV